MTKGRGTAGEESRSHDAAPAIAAIAAIAYGEYRLSPFTRLRAAALGTSGVRGAEMVRSSES
jgi:5-enolpyruvylshikimate-3-phosphate synthase